MTTIKNGVIEEIVTSRYCEVAFRMDATEVEIELHSRDGDSMMDTFSKKKFIRAMKQLIEMDKTQEKTK